MPPRRSPLRRRPPATSWSSRAIPISVAGSSRSSSSGATRRWPPAPPRRHSSSSAPPGWPSRWSPSSCPAARADVTVLVCGETGVGKELVARAVHTRSPRHRAAFVKVNCAAMPRELLESELFGHERGAFTGAHQRKPGRFEVADGGTIFLDEIGELHPALQAKLLHVLQDGEFSRVGGRHNIRVDGRVICATHRDLVREVAAGRFREDLLYRLNVINILVPPLRERREEIPGLVSYFVHRYSRLFNFPEREVSPEAMSAFMQYAWPGNIRELENFIKRMIVLQDFALPRALMAPTPVAAAPPAAPEPFAATKGLSLKEISRRAVLEAERVVICRALQP